VSEIDIRKLSAFQTDDEFIKMMKRKINKIKFEKNKKEAIKKYNSQIANKLKTSLNKTNLPKTNVNNIIKKVDSSINKTGDITKNFNNAKKLIKKEIKDITTALPKLKPKSLTKTKTKVKATAANTKDYNKTLNLQKKLIRMGAKITADGIMGPRTRAAIQKFMKKKSASPIMSKKTSSIKTTPSKFGGRISMSARLKEIDDEKKRANMKAMKDRIVKMARARKK
jgi:murein L,D-transpeptidase YcbB/YkuD